MAKSLLKLPLLSLPMLSWNLESLHMEKKKLNCHKTEAATRGVLQEKVFLNFAKFTGKHCVRISFLIVLQNKEDLWATASDKTYYFHCISIP